MRGGGATRRRCAGRCRFEAGERDRAAKGFPRSVRLAINDAWSMANDAYPDFIKKQIREGAKIDVVGFQKHIFRPANLLTVASGYPCLTNSQTWNLDDDTRRLAELDTIGKPSTDADAGSRVKTKASGRGERI